MKIATNKVLTTRWHPVECATNPKAVAPPDKQVSPFVQSAKVTKNGFEPDYNAVDAAGKPI